MKESNMVAYVAECNYVLAKWVNDFYYVCLNDHQWLRRDADFLFQEGDKKSTQCM